MTHYTATLAYPGASTTNEAATPEDVAVMIDGMLQRHFGVMTTDEQFAHIINNANLCQVTGTTREDAVVRLTWTVMVRKIDDHDELVPGVDYDVSACPNCGRDEHTDDEWRICYESCVGPVVDHDRDPHEACERGTVGCCVSHARGGRRSCEPW